MTGSIRQNSSEPAGEFTSIDGEQYYRISACHKIPSFLVSVVSDTDLWMFATSSGGLTAGRVDTDGSLFPYETVDKLHDAHYHTGPITLLRVWTEAGTHSLWQPFSEQSAENFSVERNLYKNTSGNRLIFEEINHDLELGFRYRWSGCDEFGLVRTATLSNYGDNKATIDMLDGLRNVLPFGAPLRLYQQSSCLVDAYKQTDYDPDTGMAIFSLTSKIVDRAEAAEELRANTVWCTGVDDFRVCLSSDAIAAFRNGNPVESESSLTGRRGNYLLVSSLTMQPYVSSKWHIAADVGRSHVEIGVIRNRLLREGDLGRDIEECLHRASETLLRTVGCADGLQLTSHTEANVHHFANALFNNMRGGVFANNYDISVSDLTDFLRNRNHVVAARRTSFLAALPDTVKLTDLLNRVNETDDADLNRLCYEYLPIYFGRRHGDPSRPWNRFTINLKNQDGSRALHYEGNWRDIFQNWEALSWSYPGFLTSFVARFVNASTVDGFNPYRITRDGIDWEVEDPDDPWSYIGYWGDHQIIYLLKFLEALTSFFPGTLENLLEREIFCYADVPYRLKPYREILNNPHSTIIFDKILARRIEERVARIGTDGKMVADADGNVQHVVLLEKLLVPLLSKLSNLIPDGGIWMNTQRPEWNDANNALVGNGISMVTLSYLRRYINFLEQHLLRQPDTRASISNEVVSWFRRLRAIFTENSSILESEILSNVQRKRIMDALGEAFSEYREKVYAHGYSGKTQLPVRDLFEFCGIAGSFLEHAIRANRRSDGLYHAYNLLEVSENGNECSIRNLYEMLEGQVAILSSGVIDAQEAIEIIESLFVSRMYSKERRSFLLYPDTALPAFLDKNVVPDSRVHDVELLRRLLDEQEPSILVSDENGVYRFNGDFRNVRDVSSALDRLARQVNWKEMVKRDRKAVCTVFEDVFHHDTFTGRSGTMYGYEGLGSVYWHMVAKLLLAVQEIAIRTENDEGPSSVLENLVDAYYRIRSGLGFEKTVVEYGAFPTDPYSHTPAHAGAQQPGMTGQVKEEILTRFGELGVRVEDGRAFFRPFMLRPTEFLSEARIFRYYDLEGERREIDVPAGRLAFTFCQVPVIYELSSAETWVRVTDGEGSTSTRAGNSLDPVQSHALFDRSGEIALIEVSVGVPPPA